MKNTVRVKYEKLPFSQKAEYFENWKFSASSCGNQPLSVIHMKPLTTK